jgi:transposase, IS30 family
VRQAVEHNSVLHDAAAPASHGSARMTQSQDGPPLAGHGAEAVRDAFASTITTLPEQLRRSLT